MKKIVSLVGFLAVVIMIPTQGRAQSFTNGDFEVPALSPGGERALNPGDTWMPGWTVGGPGGDIAMGNGSTAYSGNQWIDFNGGNSPPGGFLSQTFSSAVGQSNTLTFYISQNGSAPTNAMSLTATALASDGGILASNTFYPALDGAWNAVSLNFTSTTTNTTVVLKDTSTMTTSVDVGLDDVTLTIAGTNTLTTNAPPTNALPCVPLPSGAVSLWHGDGNAEDAIGGNNGVALNGAGYTSGEVGEAFNFTGLSQIVDVGSATNLWLQNFTIEAWIKRASTNTTTFSPYHTPVIFGFGSLGYCLALTESGIPFITQIGVDGRYATNAVADTQWHHVAVTATNGSVVFYIDGAVAGAAFYNPGYTFGTHASIGARSDDQSAQFNGAIDEVTVYNRALNANEIHAIYAAGSSGKCSPNAGATAQITNGVVSGIVLTNGGYGYTNTPIVLIEGGGGIGATATAVVSNGIVTAIILTDAGAGYTNAPTVLIGELPSISHQPLSVTAVATASASFNVTAPSTEAETYQWQFDGTNITDATNATLTLTNLAVADSGSYTAVVSDAFGSVTSSNAILNVGYAPSFSLQPQNQSVAATLNITFAASADGSSPLAYQWRFNGAAINSATNSTFTITDVTTNDAGVYSVVATNAFGAATSSNATLTVLASTIQIPNFSVNGGAHVTVPVQLVSLGTESAVEFSLDFDPTILTFSGAVLGKDAQGDLLSVVSNALPSGQVGLIVLVPSGTFSAGTNDMVDVTFQGAVLTNAKASSVTFGGNPTPQQVSDALASALPTRYVSGSVMLAGSQLEGDVAPLPNGDGAVSVIDWVQEERFVAGLDTITNAAEFQRADCAPRLTGGDGQITVADLTQLGRYAAASDPLTAVGEFTTNGPSIVTRKSPTPRGGSRTLSIVPIGVGALTNSVYVALTAQGGENALQFSVDFNSRSLQYLNATLGPDAPGAVLVANTTKAASGSVGFVLGLPPGATAWAAGSLSLLRLNFASLSYSNNAALTFGDTPVIRQLVDNLAAVLPVNYQNATIAVGGTSWPAISISQTGANATLSCPVSAASSFVLESAPAVDSAWTPVAAAASTNGSVVTFTLPVGAGQTFFRLHHQ